MGMGAIAARLRGGAADTSILRSTLHYLTLHPANAQGALQLFVEKLASSSPISFACVALLGSEEQETYGVAAIHGQGEEHFPALLASSRQAWLQGDALEPQQSQQQKPKRFTLSPKQVFLTSTSDWAMADTLNSGGEPAPCFFECQNSIRGLPCEARWLARAGMQSMLSLPCLHEGSVWGVLTVASTHRQFGHTLLKTLQHLCHQVTPIIVETRKDLESVLSSGQPSRFQSTNDLASCMLDELVQLDKILVKRINHSNSDSILNEKAAAMALPCSPQSVSACQMVCPTPPIPAPPLARPSLMGLPSKHQLGSSTLDYAQPLADGAPGRQGVGHRTSKAVNRPFKSSEHTGHSNRPALVRSPGPSYTGEGGMVHDDISALLGEALDAAPFHALKDFNSEGTSSSRTSGQYTHAASMHPAGASSRSNMQDSSVQGYSSSCCPSALGSGAALKEQDSSEGGSLSAQNSALSSIVRVPEQMQPRGSSCCPVCHQQPCDCLLLLQRQRDAREQQDQRVRQLPEQPLMIQRVRKRRSGAGDLSQAPSTGKRGSVQPGVMVQTQEVGWGCGLQVKGEVRNGSSAGVSKHGGGSPPGAKHLCMGSPKASQPMGGLVYENMAGGSGEGDRVSVWTHQSQQEVEVMEVQQRGMFGMARGSVSEEGSGGDITCTRGLLSRASTCESEAGDSDSRMDPKLWGLDVFVNDSSVLDDFSRRLQGSAAYVAAVAQAQDDQDAMVLAASDRASTNRSMDGRASLGGTSQSSRGPSNSGRVSCHRSDRRSINGTNCAPGSNHCSSAQAGQLGGASHVSEANGNSNMTRGGNVDGIRGSTSASVRPFPGSADAFSELLSQQHQQQQQQPTLAPYQIEEQQWHAWGQRAQEPVSHVQCGEGSLGRQQLEGSIGRQSGQGFDDYQPGHAFSGQSDHHRSQAELKNKAEHIQHWARRDAQASELSCPGDAFSPELGEWEDLMARSSNSAADIGLHCWRRMDGALEFDEGFEDDADVVTARAAQHPAQYMVSDLLHSRDEDYLQQQQQQQHEQPRCSRDDACVNVQQHQQQERWDTQQQRPPHLCKQWQAGGYEQESSSGLPSCAPPPVASQPSRKSPFHANTLPPFANANAHPLDAPYHQGQDPEHQQVAMMQQRSEELAAWAQQPLPPSSSSPTHIHEPCSSPSLNPSSLLPPRLESPPPPHYPCPKHQHALLEQQQQDEMPQYQPQQGERQHFQLRRAQHRFGEEAGVGCSDQGQHGHAVQPQSICPISSVQVQHAEELPEGEGPPHIGSGLLQSMPTCVMATQHSDVSLALRASDLSCHLSAHSCMLDRAFQTAGSSALHSGGAASSYMESRVPVLSITNLPRPQFECGGASGRLLSPYASSTSDHEPRHRVAMAHGVSYATQDQECGLPEEQAGVRQHADCGQVPDPFDTAPGQPSGPAAQFQQQQQQQQNYLQVHQGYPLSPVHSRRLFSLPEE